MTAPLWTAADLEAATAGSAQFSNGVLGVSIDSRAIDPGDLFVALRDARDGHDFVRAALDAGAAAALVDRVPSDCHATDPLLVTSETLAALMALGRAGRGRSQARMIAVTGSVGKTTTKELLRTALAPFGPVHASVASYNNHWGVPLTLARMPTSTRHAIIEIGMNHRGEIAPLSRMARPHIAVITAIAPAHIGHLGSLEAIADEKADICAGLEPDGVAVLPQDSPLFPRMAAAARRAGARVIGFGEAPAADARLLAFRGAADGSSAELSLGGRVLRLELRVPGKHVALNACAALAAVAAAGADPGAAALALAAFEAGSGRGRRLRIPVRGGTALLLDDSYNASTASIRSGLAVLAAQPARRRIVALGDMRELGEQGPSLHQELAADVAAVADLAFCCGPLMEHLFRALPPGRRGAHTDHSVALLPHLRHALRPGDAVLVKGSNGSRMEAVAAALIGGG